MISISGGKFNRSSHYSFCSSITNAYHTWCWSIATLLFCLVINTVCQRREMPIIMGTTQYMILVVHFYLYYRNMHLKSLVTNVIIHHEQKKKGWSIVILCYNFHERGNIRNHLHQLTNINCDLAQPQSTFGPVVSLSVIKPYCEPGSTGTVKCWTRGIAYHWWVMAGSFWEACREVMTEGLNSCVLIERYNDPATTVAQRYKGNKSHELIMLHNQTHWNIIKPHV